jgi:glycine dehydrogenase
MTGFADRHLGPRADDQAQMLKALEVGSLEELIDLAVPAVIRSEGELDLPDAQSEHEVLATLRELADRNEVLTSLIGLGYSGTVTPPVVLRNVLENPAWYTAYTPYQPEISQGRLEALLNFQTMVSDLTGMDLANASLLDEGTAAAEAMTMCRRVAKVETPRFFVDEACHPQTIDVVRTRAEPLGIEVVTGDPLDGGALAGEWFGALLQYPDTFGRVRDLRPAVQAVHDAGGLVTVATDLLALVLLTPPGEWGADVVVGNSQRFGVPFGFGGPHAAFMATRDSFKRSLPGRLVGVSVDTKGRRALRLALQTREQHIRREKATSNICTAQVLLANMAGFYAVWHGPEGLREIAERIHGLTAGLATALASAGLTVTDSYFDTITVTFEATDGADEAMLAARARGINLRRVSDHQVGIALDETTTAATAADVLASFGVDGPIAADPVSPISPDLLRTSDFLTHPVFHEHRSETEMLRYLRFLADRDIALDRSMIPLGSCTMKLNATTEMIPVTWPEFGQIHPFAPVDQAEGYLELIRQLCQMLEEITGYAAVSVQPNAGSQGEYAGLLAIKRYHESRGESERDVCLIPSSAHGTNAASAVMAGMRVVVTACDDQGNIDLDDLRTHIDEHRAQLAALMVTYPSTHGVFEASIVEVCGLIHDAGGQVYLDGANLNALVGVAQPGVFGSDVSHLNLHKTFCIPHGGGGPGVGPIGVREHLAPFLPNSTLVPEAGPDDQPVNAISAAPWGSAGILPISWTYIRMMGAPGLLAATEVAILNANYVARRLSSHFPVLYVGQNGFVAHECILDVRQLKETSGVVAEDVAKRLIDYGFHAPTLSFPVAGTLMVEPTESEPKEELDRFCDAMIAIREEIARVEKGEWPRDDNPLVNAPHTAEDVVADDWSHPYTREEATFPVASLRRAKYFPPVSRIDAAYGDKNVVCACPPPEAFAE